MPVATRVMMKSSWPLRRHSLSFSPRWRQTALMRSLSRKPCSKPMKALSASSSILRRLRSARG